MSARSNETLCRSASSTSAARSPRTGSRGHWAVNCSDRAVLCANYRSACRGDRTGILRKIGLMADEADETLLWLEAAPGGVGDDSEPRASKLFQEADELTADLHCFAPDRKGEPEKPETDAGRNAPAPALRESPINHQITRSPDHRIPRDSYAASGGWYRAHTAPAGSRIRRIGRPRGRAGIAITAPPRRMHSSRL